MTTTLPEKRPGEHRWVAMTAHTLTHGQARLLDAGSVVNLDEANRVATDVGCVDCEEPWPAPGPCTADVTSDDFTMSSDEQERVLAATDALARSGARGLEIGHLEDGVPSPLARWYATARWKGAKVSAEEHANPLAAVEDLLAKVMMGGQCVACGKTIVMTGRAHSFPDGATCVWDRLGDMWIPGCIAATDIDAFIAERKGTR